MSVIAAQFRTWRKRHGLNQTKAGHAIGRSLPQIQRYEDGSEIPLAVVLVMVAVEAEIYATPMVHEVWARVGCEDE